MHTYRATKGVEMAYDRYFHISLNLKQNKPVLVGENLDASKITVKLV